MVFVKLERAVGFNTGAEPNLNCNYCMHNKYLVYFPCYGNFFYRYERRTGGPA